MNRCSVKYFCGSPACWNHFEAIETADLSTANYKMVILRYPCMLQYDGCLWISTTGCIDALVYQ